jgi:hypothetical protein
VTFFFEKGPAADSTDAPQPWGYCAAVWWRLLVFLDFPCNVAPVETNLRDKTEVLGGKTCPSATLSTTNPTWTDPGSNLGLRGERPAINRLSHGTAHFHLAPFEPNLCPSVRFVSVLCVYRVSWTKQLFFPSFNCGQSHGRSRKHRVLRMLYFNHTMDRVQFE